eukprot:75924-Prorocentrum_minimum.AAC.1
MSGARQRSAGSDSWRSAFATRGRSVYSSTLLTWYSRRSRLAAATKSASWRHRLCASSSQQRAGSPVSAGIPREAAEHLSPPLLTPFSTSVPPHLRTAAKKSSTSSGHNGAQ